MKQKAMGRKISYLEIAEEMRRTLRSGIFSPGEAVISGRALAREKGVSFGTANKAIAHLAKEGFLERRIGSGTFLRSRKRKLERKKKFTVGFSLRQQVSNSKLEYLLKIPEEKLLQELEEYCRMVPFPIEDLRKEKTFEKLCRHLDGLLVCAGTYPVSEISGFRDLRIPCVLIQGDFEYDLPLHQVIPAHWTGLQEMFAAAEEWKLNGVVILYPDHQNGRARKDACVRAAEEFGYAKIETVNAGYGAINYYRIGLEIASRCRRCLVFTCTDLATFELYRAFQDRKMRPSEDFHLVGYDNVEGYGLSPFPEPVATAIEMDRYTITKKAAEILLSELNHPSGVYHTIRVPTHLVIRKSAFRKEKIYAPAH